MKIQQIKNQKIQNNTHFKATSKLAQYSISSLIASSSIFMLSNAVDSFEPTIPRDTKKYICIADSIASVLCIVGTALGVSDIIKNEED